MCVCMRMLAHVKLVLIELQEDICIYMSQVDTTVLKNFPFNNLLKSTASSFPLIVAHTFLFFSSVSSL